VSEVLRQALIEAHLRVDDLAKQCRRSQDCPTLDRRQSKARRVLNQAIFTRLKLDADDDGLRVTDDEPTEPFAPLIHAHRAVQRNGGAAAHQGNETAADDDQWRTPSLKSMTNIGKLYTGSGGNM
jgi:hypothetical protein